MTAAGQAFQCYNSVDISGNLVASFNNIVNDNVCASLCLSNPFCTMYTFSRTGGVCSLRNTPFTGTAVGTTGQSSTIAAACLRIATSGEGCSHPLAHVAALSCPLAIFIDGNVFLQTRSRPLPTTYGKLTFFSGLRLKLLCMIS